MQNQFRWICILVTVGGALSMARADIPPGGDTLDVMSPDYRGVLAEELPEAGSPVAGVYQKYCEQCHHMVDPRHHTRNEWEATLKRMRNRTKAMDKTYPSEQEWNDMQDYLMRNARKPQ